MSTHSFCSRRSWRVSRISFSLLAALFMTLSLALSPFSRVFASSVQPSFATPPTQDVARAGVSVVRLIASYTTGTGKAGQPVVEVQCTGLGVLVASWTSPGGSDQNTWILTDGSLVNGSITKNAGTVTCGNINTSGKLSALTIFLSTAYHPNEAPIQIDTGVQSEVFCQNPTNCSQGAALFSFSDSILFPYADLSTAGANSSQPVGIGLTQSATSSDTPQPVNSDAQHDPQYAQSIIPRYLTPHHIATNDNSIEPGTPLVDASGFLVSMHLNSGSALTTTAISAFMKTQPALQQSQQNLVHDSWNTGITEFYQHHYPQAHNTFQQAVVTNAQFQGASDFAQLAAANAQQNVANSSSGKTSVGGAKLLNIFLPYWLLSIIGLVLLIGILLITTLLSGRSHERHRRFKAEIDEANRQATAEANRIKEIEVSQHEVLSQQPTLLPLEPATSFAPASPPLSPLAVEQRCPHCNEPLLSGTKFCAHCRLPLPFAGTGRRSTGALPTSPLPPSSPIVDQPTLDMASSISHTNGSNDQALTESYSTHLLQHKRSGLAIVTRTNPGIKRQYKPNEDNLFAGIVMREVGDDLQQFGLLVIADGMGGHANGQDASRIAIQTIINYMLPRLAKGGDMSSEDYKQLMLDGVQSANQAVHQSNVDSHGDMGTTMTGTLIVDTTAYIANVGDSRTYLYRESEGLTKVTQDHSVVASLVSAGIIKPDDIYTHPKRNQIYRSLGERANVEIDPFVVQLQPNDKMLLCSDGLWDMVRDPRIEDVIKQNSSDLEATGDGLIKAALDGGGEDNVSIVVAHITDAVPPTTRPGLQLIYKPDSVQLPAI